MVTYSDLKKKGFWLCYWEFIFGVCPPEKAWKPDDEPFVITDEGDKICVPCAEKWHEGKLRDRAERQGVK